MSHKFIQSIIIGVCCMFLLGACSSPSSEPRERLSFNPNRSLEKDSCHFLMTAIRKTALYMLDL